MECHIFPYWTAFEGKNIHFTEDIYQKHSSVDVYTLYILEMHSGFFQKNTTLFCYLDYFDSNILNVVKYWDIFHQNTHKKGS